MLGWMAYVLVVGLFLAAAAYAAERAAQLRGGPARWIWLAAILASLLLPSVIASVSVQAPPLHPPAAGAPGAAGQLVALRQLTSSGLKPSAWLLAAAGPNAASPSLDRILQGAWLTASAGLLLALAIAAAELFRRRRGWDEAVVAGARVFVSDNIGPAVVGLLRPRIVVPRWITTAPGDLQQMVIAHERSHLDAGDARLLAIGVLLVVGMPWNLPLWWQLRRLRFAIEMDCDARVLNAGRDVAGYGRALLAVGERGSGRVAVVAGMAESKTFLEQRLRKMISKQTRFAWAAATGLAALGVVLAASAAEVSPPNAGPAAGHQEVKIDPKLLDAYAGFYVLADNAVLTVKREGDHLSIQLTGQPESPIFPESRTSFFSKIVNAQFAFQTDRAGKVASVVLHQNGQRVTLPRVDAATAQQVAARTEARFKAQTASPGTEAAARKLESSIVAGAPDYADMSPLVAEATRAQLPRLKAWLEKLGPMEEVRFLGVSSQGADVYDIRHPNGFARWTIALGPDGKVSTAWVAPGP
jgi:beta-lactamase regulating signal transducer with metallopeptidase domain